MNLICFPHYTCGGLLCDIFNNTFSNVSPAGGINSFYHSIGKIGDANDVFENFNVDELYEVINKFTDKNIWIGTHCHPQKIDTSIFNKIFVITTQTYQSKIFRWARAYHLYFEKTDIWLQLSGQDLIDKKRETAKNYIKGFDSVYASNITNLEFAEVVLNSQRFQKLMHGYQTKKHLTRWYELNSFLFDPDFWKSECVSRYYEAEYENFLNISYEYH
jgi:hypothetical protein